MEHIRTPDNRAAAAYGAAVGDNLAYYGLLLVRDIRARTGSVPAGALESHDQ